MGAAPPTLELERCPACHAPGGEEFTLGEAALRCCPRCGAVYSQRYADPDAVYVDGYYTGGTDFGIDVRHPRFQAVLAQINARRAALLERQLGGRKGSLLDVGCGTGDFMAALRDRGWRVKGVDPIQESVDFARGRGLDAVPAMLEDSGIEPGDWDVVSALHVLEHVPDGVAFLRMLGRWARPGGHVVIESPNWESHLRGASGERWIHLRPLEHVAHYAPPTVATAFRAAGLEPVDVVTRTWPAEIQTTTEALADLGRFRWTRAPDRIGRAVARVARAADHRRGRGMVVWGLARTPDAAAM